MKFLKKRKITRITPKAIEELEQLIQNKLDFLAQNLHQQMLIEGKKTLNEEIIKKVLEKQDFEEDDFF